MSTLAVKSPPRAVQVACSEAELTVDLSDGRRIAVPIVWFPRLAEATAKQRNVWKFLGNGTGIHWPLVDEDISVAALLAGSPPVAGFYSAGEIRDLASKAKTRMEEIWERWHSEPLNIDPVRFRKDIDRGIDTTSG